MTLVTTRRSAVATLFAALTLPIPGRVSAQQGTPPVDHQAHHAGTPTPTTETPGMGTMGTPGTGGMMPMGEFDLMFIDMMTPHHAGAIAMSEVALERGEHPELVTLAQAIIDSQQAENEQMQAWREAWYPDAPTFSMDDMMGGMGGMMEGMPGMEDMSGMMGMGMMGMMDPEAAAQALQDAPEPFDLAFLNAMIPHHLMALMMTEMAVQQAVHPELAELAQAMFDMQLEEIGTMQSWRAAWFGTAATPVP